DLRAPRAARAPRPGHEVVGPEHGHVVVGEAHADGAVRRLGRHRMDGRQRAVRLEEPLAARQPAVGAGAAVAHREPAEPHVATVVEPHDDDVALERCVGGAGLHQTIRARASDEMRSTTSTSTSTTPSSVATSRYWKSCIELKIRKPMPPAPTTPSTS